MIKELEVLFVEREWVSAYNQLTTLKTTEGKVVAIIREHNKQPRKGSKTIALTNRGIKTTYKLDWSNIK